MSRFGSSLCILCILCVSVVDDFRAKTHHRDTENTELHREFSGPRTFSAKPLRCFFVVSLPDLCIHELVDRLTFLGDALSHASFKVISGFFEYARGSSIPIEYVRE